MRVSRRMLLFASVAAASLVACGGRSARVQTLYVAPDGAGDGSTWETAAGLTDLDDLVSRVRPGGEILVAADRGEYALDGAIEVSSGGGRGEPIHVRGVNSATNEPMPALLRGDRTGDEMGTDVFRLVRGADHLRFSHFDFRAVGNGCFRVGAPITDLTIEDCAFEDIYRFLENTASGDEDSASLRQFAVRRCAGSQVERGFSRIRYASRDGVFEECSAQGRANQGGDIPVGCALDDNARDILYRACVMEGFQQWHAGEYWNGDGFSDEWENKGIRYEACEARGSTDGGFDCKGPDVVLENCIAEDNKRNFRLWGDNASMTGCTSRNPNFRGAEVEAASACHVWIGSESGHVRIANLTIEDRDAAAILAFEHGEAQAEIRGIVVHSPRPNWGEASVRTEGGLITASQD